MKFKIDENLPQEVCGILQETGRDAVSVAAQRLAGAKDSRVFEICQTEQRVLVTLDVGFANIRAYPPQSASELIVLRPSRQDKSYVLSLLRALVPLLDKESLVGKLWIVEDDRVRIRG